MEASVPSVTPSRFPDASPAGAVAPDRGPCLLSHWQSAQWAGLCPRQAPCRPFPLAQLQRALVPTGPGKLAPASEDCDGEGRGGGRGGRSRWHGPGTETCVRPPGADAEGRQTVARALRGSSVESKHEWNWNSPRTRSRGPGGEVRGPPSTWGAALGSALGGPRRAQPSTTCLHPDRQVHRRVRGS